MKKNIVIVSISFIFCMLVSVLITNKCTENKESSVLLGDTLTSEGKVMEFEYKNHKFINIIKIDNNGNQESFVVHDPNCHCTSKKLNNITTVITNTDNHNKLSTDSIVKANFKVVLSKLNSLHNDNVVLVNQIKTLRTEVAMLKRMKTNTTYRSNKKVKLKRRK